MKTFILCFYTFFISSFTFSQTASNFTCNDCAGVSHDLFTELDEGKVIVLCWVMPCASCIAPTIATYDVVQSFASSNPDKVFMYLCDDFGNTSCATLSNWAIQNHLPKVTKFSNTAISMTDYGTEGMPKIVVLGGPNHTIFYNADNNINNTTVLHDSISSAIASTSDINYQSGPFSSVKIFPNPASVSSELSLNLNKSSIISIDLYNFLGQKKSLIFSGLLHQGKTSFVIKTSTLNAGIYFIKIDDFRESKMIKLIVIH